MTWARSCRRRQHEGSPLTILAALGVGLAGTFMFLLGVASMILGLFMAMVGLFIAMPIALILHLPLRALGRNGCVHADDEGHFSIGLTSDMWRRRA